MASILQWALKKALPSNVSVGFEDVLHALKTPEKYVLVNTLPLTNQTVLIKGTLAASEEEAFFDEYLNKYVEKPKTVILYGANSCDPTVHEKRTQLLSLGISDVLVYSGGLFEWLLLQDIYGLNEFPTTSRVRDLLAYRPKQRIL
jgi:hypothetical protein